MSVERYLCTGFGGGQNMNNMPSMFFLKIESVAEAKVCSSLEIMSCWDIKVRLDSRYAKFQIA